MKVHDNGNAMTLMQILSRVVLVLRHAQEGLWSYAIWERLDGSLLSTVDLLSEIIFPAFVERKHPKLF